MSFLISMLPIYLAGNLHCLGMCGPLVMAISTHPYRVLYFFGRALSFSLLGLISATFGMGLATMLKATGVSAGLSFAMGVMLLVSSVLSFFPMPRLVGVRLARGSASLSMLLLKNRPSSTFYFGFFTPLLPCGQTLLVYSAIALYGDPLVGLINGFLFALLTSPSLVFAMRAAHMIKRGHAVYVLPLAVIVPASMAFLRGFAELGLIEHASINLALGMHFVLY